MKKQFKIEVTIEEINSILTALYREVASGGEGLEVVHHTIETVKNFQVNQ